MTSLTGNNVLVTVLLLVLLRLTYQTVVQWLQILKILPGGKTDVQKNQTINMREMCNSQSTCKGRNAQLTALPSKKHFGAPVPILK